ncbi:Zinc finger, RING/FYVE/PHD-type [Fusarium oxysporum f. sp. vasinfectum]|nr:Zinc finger, RING/FYVE/PHD-type [Fusarium oxysporum f. sp. vasinfectum]
MASTITEAQAELIRSLAPDDIPIKLRCAICSKLAVNAYRLPCCEQAICESCQSNLPASCPVCEHSPLSAEDCNPNKSLRTTIRVFLRTAEKKREASRPKEDKDSEPATPVDAPKQNRPTTETSAIETPIEQISGVDAPSSVQVDSADKVDEGAPVPHVVQENITHHDDTPATESPRQVEAGDAQSAPAKGSTEDAPIEHSDEQTLTTQNGEGGINGAGEENEQQMDAENDEDQDQEKPDSESMNGNFPNGSFSSSGDFNQMQMMMAMQNGMTPNSFGGFPMMGMPGMGMDPMTMQNMYMNGGFQGMGMNGMGGFGGGFGQGSNNNWNGSQSWNFDQNNYNQNGPGMGTGDFGGFNSGFQTGYNQGNYGQFNDYRRNTFGRGRGRGGYQFGGNPNYQDQTQGQFPQIGPGQNGQNGVDQGDGQQQVDESGQPIQGDSTEGPADAGQADGSSEAIGNADAATGDASSTTRNTGPGNSDLAQGNVSGAVRPVAAADVPLNAPTGPKAMRQGLPNTSLHHLRARGYQVGSEVPPSKPTGVRDSPADRGRSRSRSSSPTPITADAREKDKDRSASRTVSRSRSRSRGHRSSRRRRRHRSESVEDDGYDDDSRRKKHRSRRHFHDDEESSRSKDKDKDEKYTDRNRSASPAESKRSSHRSRRDRDSDKRRDREKDKDDDRKKSSHRPSHRDRDYDRDRRREKGQRSRESIDAGDSKPISGPRGHDTKVKTGSSSRTENSGKDPHTLEREARDRERLLKEAQRIAGMAGWKRSRGDDGDDAGSRKGRRTGSSTSAAASRRSEAINGGDEEERMRRLEAEREGDRWG